MEFQHSYDAFVRFHTENRSVHEAERIRQGLNHAEKAFVQNVWWPAFLNFDGLHPEYEIQDFKDGCRYIDFVYLRPHFRIAIEIDGLGSHWQDITQDQFSDHIQRQNHLIIDGWHVLRFTYKDVQERPRLCQQTIQQLIGRLTGDSSGVLKDMKVLDREIIRMAMGSTHPTTVRDVMDRLDLQRRAATRHLKGLSEVNWLEPIGGPLRFHAYRIHPSRSHIQL